MRIVTGHTGEAQVTAALEGLWKAGVAGEGSYVLPVLDRLSCTVDTANQVTIGTGAAVINGREVAAETPTALVVASGTQAMRRHDLVCARYRREGTGQQAMESADLVVLQGTPHATDPNDPTVPAGSVLDGAQEAYLPLWRLSLDGVNLGSPERVSTELPALAGLVPSGGTILPNGCWWERRGDLLVIQLVNVTCRNGATRTVGTLPEAVRPREAIRADGTAAIGVIANDGSVGLVYCNVSGAITAFVSGNSASGDYTGQLVVALG